MSEQNNQGGNSNDPRGGGNGQGPPGMRMNRNNTFGWVIILMLLGFLGYMVFYSSGKPEELSSWGEMVSLIESNKIDDADDKGIIVKDGAIIAYLRPEGGETVGRKVSLPIGAGSRDEYVGKLMEIAPNQFREDPSQGWVQALLYLLPWVLFLVIIWFVFFRAMRGGGGGMGMLGNFGRSRHKLVNKEMTSVTLGDVAGIEEAKEEVNEIIEFLRHPKKFQRLGGRIPRGVLLVGQPGCGKTLLAKAMAGEAEVPFFSISGSDFVEMFVGVGASRVRDLFKQAKDNSPCIIFLDEIDAVGRRRGSGFSSGGHDEREQTLNAILVEMDGFETNDQVIVIAATNRSDVLDPALTRPGRFDRQISVPLPDIKGRLEILRVHAKKVKMAPSVDMERVARQTPMFSGADLAAIINEAAIIATMENKDFIEMSDLEEARDKVKFGRAYRSRKVDEEERVGTAYHEAGHTIVNVLMPECDPLHKVTIIPRGQAMGATFSLPEKDRYGYGRRYVEAELRRLCAGRIAEERKTGDVSSGAAMDIRMATQYAKMMVLEWGMSPRLGFVNYGGEEDPNRMLQDKGHSDDTARIIDEEVKRLVDEAYADAERMVSEKWEQVTAISDALLKFETLSASDVEKIMAGEVLDKPTVSELLDAEAAKGAKPDPPTSASTRPDAEPEGGAPPLPSPA